MKFLFGFNAVPIAMALLFAAPQAWAGCSLVQTASNELVIKTSVGGCDGAALRAGLSSALGAAVASPGMQGASRESALGDVKRSSSQSALWRLANMNNQAGLTILTMPGVR